MISPSVRRLALTSALLLTSCDFVHGVQRVALVGDGVDVPSIEAWVMAHPEYEPQDSHPWDGEVMWHRVQRGGAYAHLASEGRELMIGSMRIGPPSDEELSACLALQDELLESLLSRFPSLPPRSQWRMTDWYLRERLAELGIESGDYVRPDETSDR